MYNVANLPQNHFASAADWDSQYLVSRGAWSTWMVRASLFKLPSCDEGSLLSLVWCDPAAVVVVAMA
jgi:hypothetical protein